MNLLLEANAVANAMSVLLALANGDTLEGNDGRKLRDQAVTYLKQIVDELRACGKYVFLIMKYALRVTSVRITGSRDPLAAHRLRRRQRPKATAG
ncbi:hypothetical protein P886_2186 [Alteromonadaceae bacterium 2753L.S.0a.02]|nr:hypothetical protein P886_2186 [Alteromonadaceae bacterium 2753L.S.0a.02]